MKNLYKKFLIPSITLGICSLSNVYTQDSQEKMANDLIQSRGEVYFRFVSEKSRIGNLTRIISIDKIKGDTIYAYANKKEFRAFMETGMDFYVLTPPSLLYKPKMAENIEELKVWDSYPTYSAYLAMMNSFANDYPELCQVHNIGNSTEGRQILFVKISDNVNAKEAEPEFMFSSSIHGDELTGCILNLRLADYLLSNYNSDPHVKELVDNLEIWINPMANPDGTYAGGDNSVSGAVRYNANSVDLNRNFPDPADGQHPDGESWQPETEAMRNFFHEHNFSLSANYHGGAEVMNYPWDNFFRRHPDDAWFQYISYSYADTAKKYGGADYFSDVSSDGVTNGYDWYAISGGRQDYMTYFCHGREITIEVSSTKLVPSASLPDYWNYNYRSMLKYIESCLYGIRGIITDSVTHEPLKAKITIIEHDADSSDVYSDSYNGYYHRMLAPGIYDLLVSAKGYKNKIIEDVVVTDYKSKIYQDIVLSEGQSPITIAENELSGLTIAIVNGLLEVYSQENFQAEIILIEPTGKVVMMKNQFIAEGDTEIELPKSLPAGMYFCSIKFNGRSITRKLVK